MRISDLFKGGLAKSTIMICVLWFCVNYVLYGLIMWLPTLLMKELGYALGKGFMAMAAAQLIGTIGQFSAGFNMDYLGRRPTITYSFICMGLTPYFLFWLGKDSMLGPVLLIVLSIFNGSSYGTIYAYTPENFPTRVRGTGVGFAGAIGRAGGMLGPTITGLIYAKIGLMSALHINMAVLVIGVIVLLTLGRETRGKTLEQITAEQTALRTTSV